MIEATSELPFSFQISNASDSMEHVVSMLAIDQNFLGTYLHHGEKNFCMLSGLNIHLTSLIRVLLCCMFLNAVTTFIHSFRKFI